jgi:hypothetical protein
MLLDMQIRVLNSTLVFLCRLNLTLWCFCCISVVIPLLLHILNKGQLHCPQRWDNHFHNSLDNFFSVIIKLHLDLNQSGMQSLYLKNI